MKNAALILKTIYDNLPMILTIIAIVAGIGIKVRNFLKQSKEDQKKQLQEQADKVVELVKESLLSIVSKAEKEWGSGSGSSCDSGAEDTDGIKRQEVKRNATCLHYIIRDLLHGDSSHHYDIADRRR